MDGTDYLSDMVKYYNEARLPAQPGFAAAFKQKVDQDTTHWARDMADDLKSFVNGQRVLEIACGMGRWTQFAAESADFVLATDAAPNLIDNARGLNLPSNRAEFCCLDAFDIASLDTEFACGMHLNFINHLPKALADRFLAVLHTKLGSGGLVFAAGERYHGTRWQEQMYSKKGSPDTFSMRRDDGFNFEIVDNEFDEASIRESLGQSAVNLRVQIGRVFWWATYTCNGAAADSKAG